MFRIIAGVSLATQSWDQSHPIINLNPKTRAGSDIGAFVEWMTIPLISLSTEVHYIQKGFISTIPVGSTATFTEKARVSYLSFPLLAKGRVVADSFELYVLAGPRFDVLLHTEDDGYSRDIIFQSNTTEIGGVFGVGLEAFQTGSVRFGAEIRYSPSFQDAFSDFGLTVRNQSFDFLLVVSF